MTAPAPGPMLDGFDPALAQFRLTRVQVVNWGPFHGYRDLAIHREGTLLTGPSGSGKSTLLDAIICVLMDRTVTFNGAAHDDGAGARERTFYSYARGMTGSRSDGAGGTRAIYQRTGATWSAVALTWENAAGRVVSACRAMYLTPATTSDSDITHALMVAEDDIDLRRLEPAARERFRQDAIRRALPQVTTFANDYGRYIARLSLLVGIRGQDGTGGSKAIRLLHKAQSSKGVHNIDETFKRFVLDDSRVQERKVAAVEQFQSLKSGYEQMVRARDQIALLTPLPKLWEELLAARESTRTLRELLEPSVPDAGASGRWVVGVGGDRPGATGPSLVETHVLWARKEALAQRAAAERDTHHRLAAQAREAQARYDSLAAEVTELEARRGDAGAALATLQRQLAEAERTAGAAHQARAALERWCQAAGVDVPASAGQLAALQQSRPSDVAGSEGPGGIELGSVAGQRPSSGTDDSGDSAAAEGPGSHRAAAPPQRDPRHTGVAPTRNQGASRDLMDAAYAAIAAVRAQQDHLAQLRAERDSYAGRRSNIPPYALAYRAAIAEGCGLDEAELPFIGELLDVAPGEERWRPAAERLLAAFGLGLVVDRDNYKRVAAYVNDHNLGARVRYTPVDTAATPPQSRPPASSIAAKITIADTPFAGWLRGQLDQRYPHIGVENATELAQHRQAVTLAGQIKHAGDLHEKDDRPGQRRERVIGFDNAQTLADLVAEIDAGERQLADLERQRDEAEARLEHARARADAWVHLAQVNWADVDTAAADHDVAALRKRCDAAAKGDAAKAAERELKRLTDERNDAIFEAESAKRDAAAAQKRWAQAVDNEDQVTEHLDTCPEPTEAQRDLLTQIAASCDPAPTLESLAGLTRAMEGAIDRRLKDAELSDTTASGAISKILVEFLHRWPDEEGDLDAAIATTPAYLERLEFLRRDDLPAALDQWRHLMHRINTMGLASLIQTLRDEREQIDERIAPVNDVMRSVPFGKDGYLQIVTTDTEPPASRAFKAEIEAILSGTLSGGPGGDLDDATLEEKYARISALMARLDSVDAPDRAWQADVLDVKRHVAISAEEHRRGEDAARVYQGVGATSGGEGQELVAATLGAALRYQLGGIEQVPLFGSVMVDEGFVKSDPDVTKRAIRALKSFGFQLLIAAPLDKYQSMEREFGSAYLIEEEPGSSRARATALAIGFEELGA